MLPQDMKDEIARIAGNYPHKQAATLPALHLVHDKFGYVSTDAMVDIADILDLYPSDVIDTMTFYQFFKDSESSKLGSKRVWICRGLACMLRGSYSLLQHAQDYLKVHCGQTTADQKVTLEFAECIGACDGAPAVLVNDEHRFNVTPEQLEAICQ